MANRQGREAKAEHLAQYFALFGAGAGTTFSHEKGVPANPDAPSNTEVEHGAF